MGWESKGLSSNWWAWKWEAQSMKQQFFNVILDGSLPCTLYKQHQEMRVTRGKERLYSVCRGGKWPAKVELLRRHTHHLWQPIKRNHRFSRKIGFGPMAEVSTSADLHVSSTCFQIQPCGLFCLHAMTISICFSIIYHYVFCYQMDVTFCFLLPTINHSCCVYSDFWRRTVWINAD